MEWGEVDGQNEAKNQTWQAEKAEGKGPGPNQSWGVRGSEERENETVG